MPNAVRDIDCHSALKQLWDYLDLELTDERMAEVGKHLTSCRHCLPHHDFGRRFLEALEATREENAMPPEVREKVLLQLTISGFAPH